MSTGHQKFIAYLTEQVVELKAERDELRAVLREALGILEIYYISNSDGTTPTITRIRRVLATDGE
jgi:hypothetical protein